MAGFRVSARAARPGEPSCGARKLVGPLTLPRGYVRELTICTAVRVRGRAAGGGGGGAGWRRWRRAVRVRCGGWRGGAGPPLPPAVPSVRVPRSRKATAAAPSGPKIATRPSDAGALTRDRSPPRRVRGTAIRRRASRRSRAAPRRPATGACRARAAKSVPGLGPGVSGPPPGSSRSSDRAGSSSRCTEALGRRANPFLRYGGNVGDGLPVTPIRPSPSGLWRTSP